MGWSITAMHEEKAVSVGRRAQNSRASLSTRTRPGPRRWHWLRVRWLGDPEGAYGTPSERWISDCGIGQDNELAYFIPRSSASPRSQNRDPTGDPDYRSESS